LAVLEFLWQHCRSDSGAMVHYFDSAPHVPGWLQDQAQMGMALLRAYEVTGDVDFLARARGLAKFILTELKNPFGGFYDISARDCASLTPRLTLIEQNGAAASFFLRLAHDSNDEQYRAAAEHALSAFVGNFEAFGVHVAPFGRALGQFRKPSK